MFGATSDLQEILHRGRARNLLIPRIRSVYYDKTLARTFSHRNMEFCNTKHGSTKNPNSQLSMLLFY